MSDHTPQDSLSGSSLSFVDELDNKEKAAQQLRVLVGWRGLRNSFFENRQILYTPEKLKHCEPKKLVVGI